MYFLVFLLGLVLGIISCYFIISYHYKSYLENLSTTNIYKKIDVLSKLDQNDINRLKKEISIDLKLSRKQYNETHKTSIIFPAHLDSIISKSEAFVDTNLKVQNLLIVK